MDEFDRLLYEGSAQLLPELSALKPPCPWKKPIGQICWGLALITITLNFWGLDTILPAVGTALLWLGLAPLRRENSGFRFAYACATLYAVLRLTAVLIQATPLDHWLASLIGQEWNTTTGPVPLYDALWTVLIQTVLIQMVLVFVVGGLWQGLKGIFYQAGQKPQTAAAGGLVILEALLIPMALIGLEGWLLVGPLLILWVCLILSLRRIGKSLDQAGYAMNPAPAAVSSGMALGVWLGLHLLMIAALPLLFPRLPAGVQTPVYGITASNSALRAELLELGFPEDILGRLDNSELARFEGAYGAKKEGYRNDESDLPDGMPSIVTVEVPVRDEKYGFRTVYLAYLHWNPNEASGGYMEGIQVAQDYHGVTHRTTRPDGLLKWQDSAGNAYTMPLDFWFDTDNAGTSCYYANFSLPEDVSGPTEGFLFWEAVPTFPETVSLYNFSVTAAHKRSRWQYPYTLPSELLASGFHAPSWQWRMYQWTSEGQLAPEGQYDPGKY